MIQQIDISLKYCLVPLKFFDHYNEANRKNLSECARHFPELYRKILFQHLFFILSKKRIHGAVLTFDWHPVMRIFASVCKELKIPTFLVTHESVFLDQDKYYWYEKGNIKRPICDYIIVWGKLQETIFLDRGVDKKKIFTLGAPKFDTYFNYKPIITKQQFCNIYGFDISKRIFLYSMQLLDSQIDQKLAILKQQEAINDLIEFCEEHDAQLLLREPPVKLNLLTVEQKNKISQSTRLFLEESDMQLVSPEESIFHVDIVLSINSTMLFEAVLMNKIAISTKYFDFVQIWKNINIPCARNKKELFYLLMQDDDKLKVKDISWAEINLSHGKFDGLSSVRIKT
ncbi:hypothetical protein IY888_07200, partial [Campylobacter volucris]|nr:hypothetical protein [Campylobacter volucris]